MLVALILGQVACVRSVRLVGQVPKSRSITHVVTKLKRESSRDLVSATRDFCISRSFRMLCSATCVAVKPSSTVLCLSAAALDIAV